MSHRHYLVTDALIGREQRFVVFREVIGLPWVRETVIPAASISAHSVRRSEVVAITVDAERKPCRVFYLRHDLGDLDGIGTFRPDEMNSVPARCDKLAAGIASECPSFDFVPDEATIQREQANHLAQVEAWKRLDPDFAKQQQPPPGFLRRLFGWT